MNQRGGTVSPIAAIPSARTSAARSSHAWRDGIGVIAAQHTTSEEIRSGALAASQSPIIPPREMPQKAAAVTRCSRMRPSTSAPSSAME